jgi:hypothetical protein
MKVLFLSIIEERNFEELLVQGEHSPGLKTISNKFHKATYHMQNNVHH